MQQVAICAAHREDFKTAIGTLAHRETGLHGGAEIEPGRPSLAYAGRLLNNSPNRPIRAIYPKDLEPASDILTDPEPGQHRCAQACPMRPLAVAAGMLLPAMNQGFCG